MSAVMRRSASPQSRLRSVALTPGSTCPSWCIGTLYVSRAVNTEIAATMHDALTSAATGIQPSGPGPRMAALSNHMAPIFSQIVFPGEVFIQRDNFCRNGYYPSMGHGVPGVRHKVYQDLIQLSFIGQNHRVIGLQAEFEFNVFGYQPGKHFFDVIDNVMHVKYMRMDNLLSAEGKQSAGQACRTFTGFNDLVGVIPEFITGGDFKLEQCAISVNNS